MSGRSSWQVRIRPGWWRLACTRRRTQPTRTTNVGRPLVHLAVSPSRSTTTPARRHPAGPAASGSPSGPLGQCLMDVVLVDQPPAAPSLAIRTPGFGRGFVAVPMLSRPSPDRRSRTASRPLPGTHLRYALSPPDLGPRSSVSSRHNWARHLSYWADDGAMLRRVSSVARRPHPSPRPWWE